MLSVYPRSGDSHRQALVAQCCVVWFFVLQSGRRVRKGNGNGNGYIETTYIQIRLIFAFVFRCPECSFGQVLHKIVAAEPSNGTHQKVNTLRDGGENFWLTIFPFPGHRGGVCAANQGGTAQEHGGLDCSERKQPKLSGRLCSFLTETPTSAV